MPLTSILKQFATADRTCGRLGRKLYSGPRWMALLVYCLALCPALLTAQTTTSISLEVLLEPNATFSDGYIIGSPRFSSNETYPIIVDQGGAVLHSELRPFRGFNFDLHPDGRLAWYWTMEGVWEILDSSLQVSESLDFIGGDPDYHDMELLEEDKFLLLGKEIITVTLEDSIPDTTDTDRAVIDCLIQELDGEDNVDWFWRASDHIPPSWCTHCNWEAPMLDAYHHNAFQTLDNGDVLLCLRNMDAVVRINRLTGALVWVAGGPFSDFTFTAGSEVFKHPHDAQMIGEDRLLLFDNGTGKQSAISRGVEYEINLETGTLTQLREWVHPDGNYASSQGSIQRLNNGGTLIGWGTGSSDVFGGGMITEYDENDNLVGSIYFPENHFSYRARKVPAGELPLIQGCRNSDACNYDNTAAINGMCILAGDPCNDGNDCTVGDAIQEDCSCAGFLPDSNSPVGCSDPEAVNYDPCSLPNVDDGSCQYAVDFRVDATMLSPMPTNMNILLEGAPYSLTQGGYGTWKGTLLLGNGDWTYRFEAGGALDTVERSLDLMWPLAESMGEQRSCFGLAVDACPGCTDPDDAAFSPFATDDVRCGEGSWVGCTMPEASNFEVEAIFDDGSCLFSDSMNCQQDLDADGIIGIADILQLLTFFGTVCE